ncbi:VOC family protein [Staphylococcus sp. ACRSN]|uniref:VOC family protein n=1 Tax=Staphylococcus sp. ACRSN TaxID=2918214 RepID=UPI001EF2099F|nr:VOC family protein [Staphylococcus sp. ACRSN]MCG7338692.1 VOC family protein [Staphylococcus sp. ACRSN]
MAIPKITTFLMFNGQAEKAIDLYINLFEDAEILSLVKYTESDNAPTGKVQHAIFRLKDQIFMAIDNVNGVDVDMNPAMSLYVTVDSAIEMERLFNGLKSGGAILMPKTTMPPFREFAWVQDQFGVNFQLALPE